MVRRALTVAFVGLVMLGVGTQQAIGGPGSIQCSVCLCGSSGGPPRVTGCILGQVVDQSHCPPCDPNEKQLVALRQDTCNQLDQCRAFLSRAPALSHLPLAGVGLSLLAAGIWLTRKRSQAAS
jgi:hypothetical protein